MTSPPSADVQYLIQAINFVTELINDLANAISSPLGALIIFVIVGLIDLGLTIANDIMDAIC
jgi:hypothetical protein